MFLMLRRGVYEISVNSFGKISNGDISARGHPIHFMFGSRVGFSGSADRMALIKFDQIQ